MKYFYSLLIIGSICSCSEETETIDADNTTVLNDSVTDGIIEYDLNEDRLSAVDYSNELSLIQQHVYDQINVLFLSGPATIMQNYNNAIFDISLKAQDVKNMESYEGGADFKSAVQNLLQFYKEELKNGFAQILPLLEKEVEDRSKEEEYKIIDYDEQFAIKEVTFFNAIAVEQDKFALANNFKTEAL